MKRLFLFLLLLFIFMSGILVIVRANWFSFDKKYKVHKEEDLSEILPPGEIRKADLKKIKKMINNNLLSGKEALHYEKIEDEKDNK